jgi:anti-anti-sigma regulatory factor
MSQKFQSSIQHRADVSYVKLGGVIDEDNELAELVDKIPVGTAVIDLGEVERINSCGVRDWVNWLAKLEQHGTRSVLVECSPSIVAQINLVNNFTGNGVVKSFYVPYFCPECDEEKVLLVEATDMGPPPHEPPTCRCDECDLVMDFDDMPDSYFAFLSNQRRLAEPEKINGAMRDFSRGSEPESVQNKIRSRASQPNLSSGSKPSVPSLPSIQRTGAPSAPVPAIQPTGGRAYSGPHSRPQLAPQTAAGQGGRPPGAPNGVAPGHRSGPMHSLGHMPPPVGPYPGQGQHGPNPMGHNPMAHQQVAHHQMVHGHAASGPNLMPPASYGYSAQSHGQGHHASPRSAGPSRSNAVVYVLMMILLAAIAMLAYLVLTK